jgi:hypothetical protein
VVPLDQLAQLAQLEYRGILEILDPQVHPEEKDQLVKQGKLAQLAQLEYIVVIPEEGDQLDKLVLEILVLWDILEELDQMDLLDIQGDKVRGDIKEIVDQLD